MLSAPKAEEELSRAIIELMLDEPFHAHFLGQLSRIITDEVSTAAVGIRNGQICLFINAQFFLNSLETKEERVAILKHEVLHLVFYHLYRFVGEKSSHNQYINNLAADLVVNQYVEPWPLPDGAILLSTFPQLELELEETLEYYYDKLIEAKNTCDSTIAELTKQTENFEKLSGLESEGENKDKNKIEKELKDWQQTRDILNENGGDHIWTDDHSKWSDDPLDQISRGELDNLVIKAKERMRPKDWTGAPGWLQDRLKEIEARRKPKIDWRRTLRIFATNACRTKLKGTMKRFSKRYGAPNPGIRIKRFQKIVAIVDTSGSMVSHDVVSALFAEIHGIWKTGAQIHVVECDSTVHRSYDYKGITPEFVEGGGGNDCDPAFEYLWEYRKKGLIDGCLFLTDGWFDKPTVKPPCKLLWILTPGGSSSEYLDFGPHIQLD